MWPAGLLVFSFVPVLRLKGTESGFTSVEDFVVNTECGRKLPGRMRTACPPAVMGRGIEDPVREFQGRFPPPLPRNSEFMTLFSKYSDKC